MLALVFVGCVDQRADPSRNQISSLILTITSPDPAHLGSPMAPITARSATFDITAVDGTGAPWGKDLDVNLFLSFGGVKVGGSNPCLNAVDPNQPLAVVHLTAGKIAGYKIDLPAAFGATNLWLDESVSHAVGASPTMFFRNPHIDEIQAPPDINAANASFCTPFDRKFVIIDEATNGGKLVVSSVFSGAFTVTDTGPGDYAHFNSVYLYSFGKPPPYIVPGRVVRSFSGNISKFVGFTELNFPLFETDENAPIDLSLLPPPAVVTPADVSNLPKLLALDAGVVTLTSQECDPVMGGTQWTSYNSFIVGTPDCSSLTNFAVELPAKTLGSFDPLTVVGRTLKVTGMLKNNSGQNPLAGVDGNPIACSDANPCARGNCVEGECRKNPYNFWTIVPRTPEDIVVQ
jgi:hypothetical protein